MMKNKYITPETDTIKMCSEGIMNNDFSSFKVEGEDGEDNGGGQIIEGNPPGGKTRMPQKGYSQWDED